MPNIKMSTSITSPDLPTVALTLLVLLASYLTALVFTPPNINPITQNVQDRVFQITGPTFLKFRRLFVLSIGVYHAYLTLTYRSPPFSSIPLCPRPENLNPALFTWNTNTVLCLGGILTAAPIRLLAFRQLGPNFTFRLAPPKKLITTGMYAYVQHPSYITNFVVILANGLLFERQDGVLGCWLSAGVVRSGWWRVVGWVFVLLGVRLAWVRVVDEEKMLMETFGKEWEVWHARTKRFIPFVV
jgi:protein-S-isoprenylcysteine O-methyltransferase Ste14